MHGDMLACIGYYILVKIVGIIHLQWTTNGKYCIGVGIGIKTNDNRSMAKDVDDVVTWDHQPYKKKGIRQQIHDQEDGEQIPQSSVRYWLN